MSRPSKPLSEALLILLDSLYDEQRLGVQDLALGTATACKDDAVSDAPNVWDSTLDTETNRELRSLSDKTHARHRGRGGILSAAVLAPAMCAFDIAVMVVIAVAARVAAVVAAMSPLVPFAKNRSVHVPQGGPQRRQVQFPMPTAGTAEVCVRRGPTRTWRGGKRGVGRM